MVHDRRRTADPRSATAPASSTRPCCSGTSASPGCGPTWPPPAPSCGWSWRIEPPQHDGAGHARRGCRSSTLRGRRHDGSRQARSRVRRHRGRRRPQRTDQRRVPRRRRACARWCSRRTRLVGGAAITEELMPGFSFTTFSYALSLLRPEIIQELDLVAARVHAADDAVVVPPDRRRRLPAASATTTRRTCRRSGGTRRTTRTPTSATTTTSTGSARPSGRCSTTRRPNVFGKDPEDAADVEVAARPPRRGRAEGRCTTSSGCSPAAPSDWLEDYFEHEAVKGYHASSSIIGSKVGPMSPGLGAGAAVPQAGRARRPPRLVGVPQGRQRRLHPGAGPRRGRRTAPRSGSAPPVASVLTEEGRAVGVALEDGTEFRAPVVVSALDPRRTFLDLVDPRELPARPGRQRRAG